jgi:tetratricopeptide (TPR) repeat protein
MSPEELEQAGDLGAAAAAWNKMLEYHPLHAKAYDRLMIIYRKQKEYRKEMKVINEAIAAFETSFNKNKPSHSKKVTALSRALLKATGLGDKKGNSIYQPGELTKWKRRKDLLGKRLRKGK